MRTLIKRQQRGERVEALENEPELYPDLQFVWAAFTELSESRSYGFGHPNPIPISEIVAWLDLNEVHSPEDRREITLLIQAMDRTWILVTTENSKAKQSGRAGNNPNGRGRTKGRGRLS
jgi:hypothetical protein